MCVCAWDALRCPVGLRVGGWEWGVPVPPLADVASCTLSFRLDLDVAWFLLFPRL